MLSHMLTVLPAYSFCVHEIQSGMKHPAAVHFSCICLLFLQYRHPVHFASKHLDAMHLFHMCTVLLQNLHLLMFSFVSNYLVDFNLVDLYISPPFFPLCVLLFLSMHFAVLHLSFICRPCNIHFVYLLSPLGLTLRSHRP